MLNRRSLRIKVMQNLFALQQCKEANYELCTEKIDDFFAPDLNSMEVQDKPLLTTQRKEAEELFEAGFAAALKSQRVCALASTTRTASASFLATSSVPRGARCVSSRRKR